MGGSRNGIGRKLVVLSGRTKGASFPLTKTRVNAGRESDNAICLKGKRVSRYHAILVRTNGEYTLRDLSPRLGTFLNGQPTKEAKLKPGDRIRIGEFEMSYEAATETTPEPSPALSPIPQDELAKLRQQLAATGAEAEEARAQAQQAAAELTRARAEAEQAADEFRGRIAALTEEVDRLAGEVDRSQKALESKPTPSPTRSDPPPANSLGRVATISRGNSDAAVRNNELQAKIAELEESRARVHDLETDLKAAQVAIQELTEELAMARRPTQLDMIAQELGRVLESDPALRAGELGRFHKLLAEARAEWDRISELHAAVEQLAVENQGLRTTAANAQEEAALAKRCLSSQTNEEFTRLRQSLVAKRAEESEKRWKFLRPFKAAPRPLRRP